MRIAVPKVIYKKYKEYTIAIAVLPPIDNGEVVEILKKNMRISDCTDKLLCYPSIFGGIFVFKREIIVSRIEYTGYFCKSEKREAEFSINEFLRKMSRNESACFQFEDSAYCFSNKKTNDSCIPIDNIGLRFIV